MGRVIEALSPVLPLSIAEEQAGMTVSPHTSPSFRACFQYAYSERLKSMYSGERSLEYMV
jgi:hypothetical protein